jgi:hypothetical protein
MKNSPTYTYSQTVNVRFALELELGHFLVLEQRNRVIIEFLRKRILELKEEEKACLKTQVS